MRLSFALNFVIFITLGVVRVLVIGVCLAFFFFLDRKGRAVLKIIVQGPKVGLEGIEKVSEDDRTAVFFGD